VEQDPHPGRRDVIVPEGSSPAEALPIRSDTQGKLVVAIARARQWLSEIEAGAATIDGIASRQACSKRHISMTISLAFLAPSLVKAADDGRLPRGIGGPPFRCTGRMVHANIRCLDSRTDAARATQRVIHRP
jgi:site-specific DNA recombinase